MEELLVMLIVSVIAVLIYFIQRPKTVKIEEELSYKPWVVY